MMPIGMNEAMQNNPCQAFSLSRKHTAMCKVPAHSFFKQKTQHQRQNNTAWDIQGISDTFEFPVFSDVPHLNKAEREKCKVLCAFAYFPFYLSVRRE